MAIYPKIEHLRSRKETLRQELEKLDLQIKQTGERAVKEGLQVLLEKGNTPAAPAEMKKLEDRHKFLLQVDEKIDEELVKCVRHDRQLAIKRIRADIARCEKERKKRYGYYKKLLEKIEVLRKEDRGFKEQKTELESQLNAIKRPEKETSLRLSELESFLKREFLLGDDLSIKVKEARIHNREVLSKGKPGIEDIIYRNFEIKYSLETGQTLELELTEQKAETILRNFDKQKLIREVT